MLEFRQRHITHLLLDRTIGPSGVAWMGAALR
jgi:hypothetical protein